MPRFYFDVFDGSKAVLDDYGDLLVEIEDAKDQAAGLLTDLAGEILPKGQGKDFGVIVRNDTGSDIYRAALVFRDAHLDASRPSASGDLCPAISVPSPVELIRQSREIRSETRAISRQARSTAAGLADLLRQAAETMRVAQATVAAMR